jgi:hypothetical protein
MEYVETTINVDEEAISAKIEELIDDTVMLQIHNLFAKMCDPYVPFLEGPLSQTIEVTPQGVKYTQPYAHYQYHGVGFNHTKDYHPLATAFWDKVMMQERGEEFIKQVEAILKARARKLYG